MMRDSYSLYEAKARFSAIVQRVREGHRVVVTVRGQPAVEIRPLAPSTSGIEGRMHELEERGMVTPAQADRVKLAPGKRRAGALKRFLATRD